MIAAILVAVAAPAGAAERTFTVTDFDRVQVEGPFEVTLVTGKASAASASGSREALDRLSIEVQGRTLKVRADRSNWHGHARDGAGPIKIALSTRALRAATIIGSGSLSVDKAKGLRFEATVSGSGRMSLASVDADNLVLGLAGSGSMEASGEAKTLRLTAQGSGDVAAEALTAQDAQIAADTSGDVTVGVRRTAKVDASGQGDTVVIGDPACIVKALGSGRVACGKD